jgi:hypothetical protein
VVFVFLCYLSFKRLCLGLFCEMELFFGSKSLFDVLFLGKSFIFRILKSGLG